MMKLNLLLLSFGIGLVAPTYAAFVGICSQPYSLDSSDRELTAKCCPPGAKVDGRVCLLTGNEGDALRTCCRDHGRYAKVEPLVYVENLKM